MFTDKTVLLNDFASLKYLPIETIKRDLHTRQNEADVNIIVIPES